MQNFPALNSRFYFDHAATSFPKPDAVVQAISHYLTEIGASAGRGAYREAFLAKEDLDQTRNQLAQIFSAKNPERFIFTSNATEALNVGLKGLLKPGDHVVTSSFEHNSVSRQLLTLQKTKNISFSSVPVDAEGRIDWKAFETAFRPETRLVAMIHASNVSGTLLPIGEVGRYCRRRGVPLLVDAAQTAGSYPISVDDLGIDLLAFPGHKGLLGPLGTGGLWVRPGLQLTTLKEGGTGSFSEEDEQPEHWPDIHESGSHNLVGIVGLKAALNFLLDREVSRIRLHKKNLLERFLRGVFELKEKIKVLGPSTAEQNAGVVSLRFAGLKPDFVATELDRRFRVQVRPGLHCAPWAHKTLGSYPAGTVRFSFGFSNTEEEVDFALKALGELGAF